eukprot:TRINITY_DN47671_c0_g1_i1.p1 TRINITY_DN47671_c0_g1~~TRINITY_DN47671_c0_g1_i1.p1  ORF type:complete len:391 (-),score=78.62 TRINITY_DN47671_c0_g1_i1:80-1198(-)
MGDVMQSNTDELRRMLKAEGEAFFKDGGSKQGGNNFMQFLKETAGDSDGFTREVTPEEPEMEMNPYEHRQQRHEVRQPSLGIPLTFQAPDDDMRMYQAFDASMFQNCYMVPMTNLEFPAMGIPIYPANAQMVNMAQATPATLETAEVEDDLPTVVTEQPPEDWADIFTVMLRNIPNKYNQQTLCQELNNAGFAGLYDFVYLPIDMDTEANKGYAFINFVDPSCAWTFKSQFDNRKMSRFNSCKIVKVMPAALQGFDANYAHYSAARVTRGDPKARPLFLREPHYTQRTRASPSASANKPKANTQADSFGARKAPAATGHASHGVKLAQAPADASGRPARFCPFCGGNIRTQYKFCVQCGSSLDSLCAGANEV